MQLPEAVYFSGDFTFSAWIYLKSYQSDSRIFDFLNDKTNVFFKINSNNYLQVYSYPNAGISNSLNVESSSIINLKQWYFVNFVLHGTTGYIFMNGIQMANGNLYAPNDMIKKTNYIGKSVRTNNPQPDAIYDEFKIYQGALSATEIMNEYLSSSSSGKLFLNFLFIKNNF